MDLLMETAIILVFTLQASKGLTTPYSYHLHNSSENFVNNMTNEKFAYTEMVNYTNVPQMETPTQSTLQTTGAESWMNNYTIYNTNATTKEMPLSLNTTVNGTHLTPNTTQIDIPLSLNTTMIDTSLTSSGTVTDIPIDSNETAAKPTTPYSNITTTDTPLNMTGNETTKGQPATLSPTLQTGDSPTVMPTDFNSTSDNSTVGSETERGLMADMKEKKRFVVWGALIGMVIAVGFMGFIIYTMRKSRGRQGFSHRKLIEDTPTEPVLRLDNGEPLNLRMDGMAYYNPALSGDNIQTTSFT